MATLIVMQTPLRRVACASATCAPCSSMHRCGVRVVGSPHARGFAAPLGGGTRGSGRPVAARVRLAGADERIDVRESIAGFDERHAVPFERLLDEQIATE